MSCRLIKRLQRFAFDFWGAIPLKTLLLQTAQVKYTLGPEFEEDLYHVATVRTPLTRNLNARFPEVQDEIAVSFDE